MKKLLDTLLAITGLAVAACGGGSSPTAPPPPTIIHARIVAPHDTSLGASGTLSTAALGYHVVDSSGAALVGYTVVITAAPATWSATATTFRPPLDTRGRVSLLVAKPAQDVRGAAIAADSVILDTASVGVTAQLDGTRYNWAATFACQLDPSGGFVTDSGMKVDSIFFNYTLDSAVAGNNVGYGAALWGSVIYTYYGGPAHDQVATKTVRPAAIYVDLPGSVVDTVYYEQQFHGLDYGVRDTTHALPYYAGGIPCKDIGLAGTSHQLGLNLLWATLDKAAP